MFGPEYTRLKKYVDQHILDLLPEIDQKSNGLYDAMKYSLVAGGKRMRPVLLLGAYEMCAGRDVKINFALPFACAAEYIQTYSLIHDDLPAMDNDDYRRGQLTNHKVFGEDMAILAGDGLLSSAYEIMSKEMLLYLDKAEISSKMIKAMFALARGTGVRGMVAGQVADVETEGKACSKEMLDFIHINKTASFIQACVLAGCYLGGGSRQQISDCEQFGESLGLAFQIVDDILDVIGDAAELGKNTGVDAKMGKSTYPAVYGLENSKQRAAELLGKASDSIASYGESSDVFKEVIIYLESLIK